MDELNPYFDIAELAGKFLQGEITGEERALLNAWIKQDDSRRVLWENLTREPYLQQQLDSFKGQDHGAAWQKLLSAIRSAPAAGAAAASSAEPASGSALEAAVAASGDTPAAVPGRRGVIRPLLRYAAAALLAGALAYIGYHWETRSLPTPPPIAVAKTLDDIQPGTAKARLVLGNGRVLALGAGTRDTIREEDGSRAEAAKDELRYAAAGADLPAEASYNSVITPRGGEYKLILSDGTKVWLNAASSIRYPTRFTGKERKVYLEGEAYLEVANDATHPFVVSTPKTNITVLGTCFNIKAYADEAYDRTSLVDGLVRVSAGKGEPVTLKPGMQSTVTTGDHVQTGDADLEEATAWKNGLFIFEHEPLESICRKLSRWYNVDFLFLDPSYKSLRFTGRVRREDHITGLLHMLESTYHVRFEQSGLTLSVGPE